MPQIGNQFDVREQEFIQRETIRVNALVGTMYSIRTTSGALRKGTIDSIVFDHFQPTASGRSKFIVWKMTQQIPRADGKGTVSRSITVRL